MPDMTKPAQDGEPSGQPEGETCLDEKCTRCGDLKADYAGPVPGSRKWFWFKRVENCMLFLTPGIPFLSGVAAFIEPQVQTPLTGAQEKALNSAYEYSDHTATTVERVIVTVDHPGIMDRVVVAAPGVVFALLLAFVGYALWRIEINMTANRRPFTAKDGKVFSWAATSLLLGWFVLFALELSVFAWFHWGPAGADKAVTDSFSDASLVVLGMSALMVIMSRVYRKGQQAYEELEKGV